jgi:hypothetical protein
MHKIVIASAVALSVLTDLPSAAEHAPGPASGTWTDVTPSGADLANELSCGNFGAITMVVDPARPSDFLRSSIVRGSGSRSTMASHGPARSIPGMAEPGLAELAIARGPDGEPPILYSAGIRGTGVGFWKSTDGGVSWTKYRVAPDGDRQDFYPPVVDPYVQTI